MEPDLVRQLFSAWLDKVRRPSQRSAMPPKGSIAVALVLIHRLKANYDLELNAHLAPGRAQIQGASGTAVKKILEEFGELRPFVTEGGLTNSGTPVLAQSLLEFLATLHLDRLAVAKRNSALYSMQELLIAAVRNFHNRARMKPIFSPAETARHFVGHILKLAAETGKRGPVAQYLVGAKLQRRFPQLDIRNDSSSAADDPGGLSGDFQVRDTVFHVTVAPSTGHYEKCRKNLADGKRVFLLVPDSVVVGARQIAEQTQPGSIAVESIESFVGQNVEELSEFACDLLRDQLRELLDEYNRRVVEVETDESLMIEIPANLMPGD